MSSQMIVSSMGLAWAMPVKPNELVVQLHKFEKALANIQELGLGHHFGEGNHAHVMNLPENVVTLIEDFVLHCTSIPGGKYNPDTTFRCFENRCEPMDHRPDDGDSVLAHISRLVADTVCKTCKTCKKCDSGTFSPKCKNNCKEKYDEGMNEEIQAEDYFWNGCANARDSWEATINQGPQGEFVKFDQLLLKHFGLKAHFASTRATPENEGMWPENPNQRWHHTKPVQTTTCYLTIPNHSPGSNTYNTIRVEVGPEDGYPSVQVGQSYFVDLPGQGQREKHVQQFDRAMRVLQIKPYIHPSQLTTRLSAEAGANDTEKKAAVEETVKGGPFGKKKRKVDKTPEKETPKVLDATSIEWPQLTILLKASAQFEPDEFEEDF